MPGRGEGLGDDGAVLVAELGAVGAVYGDQEGQDVGQGSPGGVGPVALVFGRGGIDAVHGHGGVPQSLPIKHLADG